MLTVTVLQGLPASGKSTYAKKLIDENSGKYKRINKDDLRSMLDNSKWSKSNEEYILKVRDFLILSGLEQGKHIIVDDTNLNPKHIEHIRELVKGKAQVIVNNDFLNVDVEECIRRDLKRLNSVGESVIRKMHYDFIYEKPAPPTYNPNLLDCIICDLDGTLADLNGRNPYDASTCEKDLLIKPVADLLAKYSNDEYLCLIFVSGRKELHRTETLKWLRQHKFLHFLLFMRQSNDDRKDAIVKQEIYNQHIKDNFNVKFVIDDRPQVIRMWKSLGLFVFNVGDGIEF